MVNVESRASRGKSCRRVPVALWVTEVICLVKRSLESSVRPGYRTRDVHGTIERWEWSGAGAIGRRRVNRIDSVL